jgi:hypothetical protein
MLRFLFSAYQFVVGLDREEDHFIFWIAQKTHFGNGCILHLEASPGLH